MSTHLRSLAVQGGPEGVGDDAGGVTEACARHFRSPAIADHGVGHQPPRPSPTTAVTFARATRANSGCADFFASDHRPSRHRRPRTPRSCFGVLLVDFRRSLPATLPALTVVSSRTRTGTGTSCIWKESKLIDARAKPLERWIVLIFRTGPTLVAFQNSKAKRKLCAAKRFGYEIRFNGRRGNRERANSGWE